MIDLHAHSNASDGSQSPAELVELARSRSLGALALVDHDTISGLSEFFSAAAATPSLLAFGGVELSAVGVGPTQGVSVHVLGYTLSAQAPPELTRHLEVFQSARTARGAAIVARLQALGLDVTFDEVIRQSGGETLGRPHVAAVLISKGYARDAKQAFDEYLADGARAWVERSRPTASEAVALLRRNGFVPVLAHPPVMGLDEESLSRFVRELRAAGLMGIESYYSSYTSQDTGLCLRMAARYGLFNTGGSDFHGRSKPEIELGRGYGSLRVPDALADKLLAAIKTLRAF